MTITSVSELNIATYNIHKGFSHFNHRMTLHELRDKLRNLSADIVFLQEVVGSNILHAQRHHDWPVEPQYEFLADSVWSDFAYGKNAIYDEGHHGNAILSRYPIVKFDNVDISTNPMETRGMLHAEINVPGWPEHLHCVCTHLGLFASGRRKQIKAVCKRIEFLVPMGAPLILAGDFNDWRSEASETLGLLGLMEVFEILGGSPARSFPARLPILRLDRIYIRGFSVQGAHVHRNTKWNHASDHAALTAHLIPL